MAVGSTAAIASGFVGWVIGRSERVGKEKAIEEAGNGLGGLLKEGASTFIRQGAREGGSRFWRKILPAGTTRRRF